MTTTRKRKAKAPDYDTLRKMEPEDGFQRAVFDLARATGWLIFHDNDPRKNTRGLPDALMVRPPRVIFAEFKAELDERKPRRGSTRFEQLVWLATLAQCPGVETYLWRPSSWRQIERVLVAARTQQAA